ncbi:hypothetical protein [Acetoanaerobium noterae]
MLQKSLTITDREKRTLKVKDASIKIKTSTRCLLVVGGNLK